MRAAAIVFRSPMLWTQWLHGRNVADRVVEAGAWQLFVGWPIGEIFFLTAVAARLGARLRFGLIGDQRHARLC